MRQTERVDWDSMPLNQLEKRLTERQRRFALAYLQNGGNGTAAAIEAGYSEKSAHVQASRMLRDDKVSAFRRAQARELYKALGITPELIGLETMGIFRKCMQAEPHLSWDSDAHAYLPDGSFVFDAKNALKALELLGNLAGAITEKLEISMPAEPMTLAQKLALAKGVLADAGDGGGGAAIPGGTEGKQ